MKSATPPDVRPEGWLALERARLARDRAARRRFADSLVPGLPVDADAPGLRAPSPRVGTLLEKIVADLTRVREPFFETVCLKWAEVAPEGFPAKPGRYRDGRLFLYVRSAAQVFSLRGRLPALLRKVKALPGAPRRLTLHLEVH